jgi:Ca2+-transporting ATPase
LITAAVVLGYDYALGAGRDVEHARAMAIVALIIANATATTGLSRSQSRTSIIVVLGRIARLLLVQVSALAALVQLGPLHLDDRAPSVATVAIAGAISFLIPLTLRR